MNDPTVRPTVAKDLDAIADIYGHHVRTGVATFEIDPPDAEEWRRRFNAVIDAGLPFITAEIDGNAAASLALHRNRGFVDADRLTAVGFKHGRWLDTLLLQRTLNRGGR